jgi:hypothetical protein
MLRTVALEQAHGLNSVTLWLLGWLNLVLTGLGESVDL